MTIVNFLINVGLIGLFLRELVTLKKEIFRKKTRGIVLHLFGTLTTAIVAYIIVCFSFNVEIENVNLIKGVVVCALTAFFFLGLDSLFMEKKKNGKSKTRKKQKK